MLDLFDAPVLPGLASLHDVVSVAEEQGLIEAIDRIELTPFRFQGWTGKRVTASFGWNYDFETHEIARADPISDWLLPLRERLAAFAGLSAAELIQALVTRYDQGAGINWHRDRPIYEQVVGLSLGAPADMRFRRQRSDGKYDRMSLPLVPRAAYHMAGEARHAWQHSIVEMDRTRWSITFRSPSALWPAS
jgi:alkylated DNA repair dioxygenase AlkB